MRSNSTPQAALSWELVRFPFCDLRFTLYWWVGSSLFQGSGLFLWSQLRGGTRLLFKKRIQVDTDNYRFDVWTAHLTSGFLKPRRARYVRDMVTPPPMKMNRGISWKSVRQKWSTSKICDKSHNMSILVPTWGVQQHRLEPMTLNVTHNLKSACPWEFHSSSRRRAYF